MSEQRELVLGRTLHGPGSDGLAGRVRRLWPAATAYGDHLTVPAVVMRGGTSRGVFFDGDHLPSDPRLRDRVILAAFGSPDPRQIDGIGGATPLTSKVAIVTRSQDPAADVDYLFGQVGTDEARVDYAGNCGNLLSAVGPFAVDEGLVPARSPTTSIRIRVVNSGQTVVARVRTVEARACAVGTTAIPGVPGAGSPVTIEMAGLGATLGRGLLPTGTRRETLPALGGEYPVSIVDAGNPTVFVPAVEIGLDLRGLLSEPLDGDVVDRLDAIRSAGAARLGLVEQASEARAVSPTIPKIYVVSPPGSYVARGGEAIDAAEVSLVARGLSMGVPHPAIATTVAVCTATAARIPGTVVAGAVPRTTSGTVRIGHPSGVFEIDSVVSLDGEPQLIRAEVTRTARRVMAGSIHVPPSVLAGA